MHYDAQAIDEMAEDAGNGVKFLQLKIKRLDAAWDPSRNPGTIAGPATIEYTQYPDGGWRAVVKSTPKGTTMKHTLKADGAPFNANGTLANDNKSTAGKGRAQCSCGEQSDILDSRAARKLWFAGHKADPVDVGPVDTTSASDKEQLAASRIQNENEAEDIIGTPPPAKKARKGSVDIDAVFTGGYAIEFARFVQKLAEEKGLECTVVRDGATRTVTIVGGTKTLAKQIDDVEVKAMEALHAWQEAAPERKDQTAGQRYKGSREFLARLLAEQS